ncbi:hypothetical protein DMUE_1076 [Dictyocoela muelleri]|nr:hypothetical protein DMUE_1076 [Dictyocoela muelleri]
MIKDKLCYDHEISMSLKTIEMVIHGFHYSLKRLTLVPARRNSIDCINNRRLYAQQIYQLLAENDGQNIIYIDEAGFNVSMRRSRERYLIGSRATAIFKNIKSRNINLCAAISKCGIIHHKLRITA